MRDPLSSGAGDKIFFDFDQAVIRDDARPILDVQADWLNRNKSVNVQIAGDCDERGTEEYNIALGNRRAYAAESYLAAKGVAPSRMTTISYGKDRPIAQGSTEEAWAQNRNAITSVR
jgi:peptidoglycan-associated lipoprotein